MKICYLLSIGVQKWAFLIAHTLFIIKDGYAYHNRWFTCVEVGGYMYKWFSRIKHMSYLSSNVINLFIL